MSFERTAPVPAGHPFVQAKLEVSKPGDALERQADRVADAVVRGVGLLPDAMLQSPSSALGAAASTGAVMRACEACAKEDEESASTAVRRDATSASAPLLSQVFEKRLSRARRTGGEQLETGTRRFMEGRFQRDFGGVRIHRGAEASDLAREAQARAFTVGRDVFFRSGEFRSDTKHGRSLLAHELTHVAQQGARGNTLRRKALPNSAAVDVDSCAGLDAAFEGCATNEPKPSDDPPPREQWFSDATLNAIRAESPGDNKVLLSRARGSRGASVGLVQQALLSCGCRTKDLNLLPGFGADRAFGRETDLAVRKFQCDESIQVDGIVGPDTLARLDAVVGGQGLGCPAGTEPIVVAGGAGAPFGVGVLGALMPNMLCLPKPVVADRPKLLGGEPEFKETCKAACQAPVFLSLGQVVLLLPGFKVGFNKAQVSLPRAGKWEVGLVQTVEVHRVVADYEKGSRENFSGVSLWDQADGQENQPVFTLQGPENPRSFTVSGPTTVSVPPISFDDCQPGIRLNTSTTKNGTMQHLDLTIAFREALVVREVAAKQEFVLAGTPSHLVIRGEAVLKQPQSSTSTCDSTVDSLVPTPFMKVTQEPTQTTRPTANEFLRPIIKKKFT